MNTVVLVIIMATAFMTLGMVLLVVKLRRTQIRSVSKVLVPNRGTGMVEGQTYTWHKSPAAQNKNPSFELTLPFSHPGRFTLRRENGFDRLGKKMGLAAEISSYDEAFDQSTYISSPPPPLLQSAPVAQQRAQCRSASPQSGLHLPETGKERFVRHLDALPAQGPHHHRCRAA